MRVAAFAYGVLEELKEKLGLVNFRNIEMDQEGKISFSPGLKDRISFGP